MKGDVKNNQYRSSSNTKKRRIHPQTEKEKEIATGIEVSKNENWEKEEIIRLKEKYSSLLEKYIALKKNREQIKTEYKKVYARYKELCEEKKSIEEKNDTNFINT